MNISEKAKHSLNETRKWTFFLSILGFVFIGLIVIGGFSIGTIMSAFSDESLPFPGYAMGFVYLILGALYFFPIYYLYKFSTNMKEALLHKTEESVEDAFLNLKSHYKFVGILTIVMLSIYLLFGIGFALVGLSL